MKDGHLHRCREGHSWEHAGPPAPVCRVPEYQSDLWGRYASSEHCPMCTRREDLLTRGPHAHRCSTCQAEWTHEGRCMEGPEAQCPWCSPDTGSTLASGSDRGPHVHDCPQCVRTWEHTEVCVAPHKVALPECPGCQDPARAFAAARLARGAGKRRVRRVAGAGLVVGGGVALGALLVWFLASSPRLSPTSPAPVRPETPSARPAVTAAAPVPAPASPAPVPAPLPPAGTRGETSTGTPREATPVVPPAPPPSESPPARARMRDEGAAPAPRVAAPRPVREATPPKPESAASLTRPSGRTAQDCVKPSRPVILVGTASGQELGPWVGVEIDNTSPPGRCLYVILRPDNTLWVIDSSRVRVRGLE